MTIKVLLLQPPVQDFYETNVRLQPIGLASIKATLLRDHPDLKVKIVDCHHGYARRTIPLPKALRHLSKFYRYADQSPFSTFHQFYHFGASDDEIREILRRERPDIVGISSLFTPYYREALNVAHLAKETTNAITVMGGSHVSAVPDFTLAQPNVDFVIRGEGELAMSAFITQLRGEKDWRSVPNLGWKDNSGLHFNPIASIDDLNSLPIPDLSDFELDDYLYENQPMTFLVTSRSCPHRCSFCSVHTTFGLNYRRRSLDLVMEEIKTRVAQGYRVIDFEDDNLTAYKAIMKEICRRLIAEFGDNPPRFLAMNGISFLSLDDELIDLMARAGFTNLNLALVSSDSTVLESSQRPHTVKKYTKVVEQGFAKGFDITSYQILGLPSDTLDGMIRTIKLAAELPVLIGASIFYLTPAAPITRQLGIDMSEDAMVRSRLTAIDFPTENFSQRDLYTLFVTIRVLNFIKSIDVSGYSSLEDLIRRKSATHSREEAGLGILRHWLNFGEWSVMTREGRKSNDLFDCQLFARVIASLDRIVTQANQTLSIHHSFARPDPQIAIRI